MSVKAYFNQGTPPIMVETDLDTLYVLWQASRSGLADVLLRIHEGMRNYTLNVKYLDHRRTFAGMVGVAYDLPTPPARPPPGGR